MEITRQIKETIEDLAEAIEKSQNSSVASIRVLKLLKGAFDHWGDDNFDIRSLTDVELLQSLSVSASVANAFNTREALKNSKRASARIYFFDKIREFGGVLKSQAVAKTLGVSRQTVNNHIKRNSLIAIQEGNDYCYPAFQFAGNRKLPHLEVILELLGGVSQEARCTFFLNPIVLDDGREELPYLLLKNGATETQLATINREASLFMRQ